MFPKNAGPGEPQHPWQYHSRSDDHSNIASLGVAIDLLRESPELREAVADGRVGFQVNPKMRDRTNREKTLDLGFGLVDDAAPPGRGRSLEELLAEYLAVLTPEDREIVAELPNIKEARSKQDLVVLENKACMTAHSKAAPRLRNELEGAVDAINSSDPDSVAGGLVLVNAADYFYSPVYRDNGYVEPSDRRPTQHHQPADAAVCISRLRNIPLRTKDKKYGYDALGIVVIDAKNNGQPWTLVEEAAYGAPAPQDIWSYTRMIQQLAKVYRQRIKL